MLNSVVLLVEVEVMRIGSKFVFNIQDCKDAFNIQDCKDAAQ